MTEKPIRMFTPEEEADLRAGFVGGDRIWRRYRNTLTGQWVTDQMMDGEPCFFCVMTDLHWHRIDGATGEVGVVLVVGEDAPYGIHERPK